MRVIIGKEYENKTIKEWLYGNGFSREMITRLKKLENGITLNKEHATVRRHLHVGDELALRVDDSETDENPLLEASDMPLDIIYEDDDLIALNKPAGIPTHPSRGHYKDTLANALAYYYKSQGKPFVFRSVNRLDRETSGVVLVAKNQYSAARLALLMQTGKIRKSYIAVLNGVPEPLDGTISVPIRRKAGTLILREAVDRSIPNESSDLEIAAKEAITCYKTLAQNRIGSIVYAKPITGRTHQLRVHFAYIGTPIAGDYLYGSANSNPTALDIEINRHALHAASLEIDFGDKQLKLDAKLPPDMQVLCNKIKGTGFLI